jgi:hypothetical protein
MGCLKLLVVVKDIWSHCALDNVTYSLMSNTCLALQLQVMIIIINKCLDVVKYL